MSLFAHPIYQPASPTLDGPDRHVRPSPAEEPAAFLRRGRDRRYPVIFSRSLSTASISVPIRALCF